MQVLFVGQPRFAKERLAEEEDLKKFTKKVRRGCRASASTLYPLQMQCSTA